MQLRTVLEGKVLSCYMGGGGVMELDVDQTICHQVEPPTRKGMGLVVIDSAASCNDRRQ